MSAVAHWRKDRRGNPTIIYPEVLTILHGKEHDCTECALSGRCQPEHACCRAYLLDHFVAIGWATNHRVDGIKLTDYFGKMAHMLTTKGGGHYYILLLPFPFTNHYISSHNNCHTHT